MHFTFYIIYASTYLIYLNFYLYIQYNLVHIDI